MSKGTNSYFLNVSHLVQAKEDAALHSSYLRWGFVSSRRVRLSSATVELVRVCLLVYSAVSVCISQIEELFKFTGAVYRKAWEIPTIHPQVDPKVKARVCLVLLLEWPYVMNALYDVLEWKYFYYCNEFFYLSHRPR